VFSDEVFQSLTCPEDCNEKPSAHDRFEKSGKITDKSDIITLVIHSRTNQFRLRFSGETVKNN
jgi:hypothetical protein